MKTRHPRGFTLVELFVVICILIALIAVGLKVASLIFG